jgi:hypothetical protein
MNLNKSKSGKVALKHFYVYSGRAQNNLPTFKSWKTTLIEQLFLIAGNQITFVTVVGLIK